MRAILMLFALAAAMPATAATTKLSTRLAGAAEVPGPGAPGGKGSADLTFDTDKGQVCYMLMSSGTDAPTMAHIHKGAVGVAGGVVVALTPPDASGMSQGCVPIAPDALAAILAKPSDYYVNIHTAAFPKGAMRGQLGGM
jgi:hypothetical protein